MVSKGEVVWVTAGGKLRPAVVVAVSKNGSRALVITGTSTAGRDIPCMVVDPSLRTDRRTGLSNRTYFYQSNLQRCDVADLKQKTPPTTLPYARWEELAPLARAASREKCDEKEFREWWPETTE
jgi:hypothetical protein